jgi:hypothetical protein
MEEGEIAQYSPPHVQRRARDDTAPPRRYEPYARPGRRAEPDKPSNYHWHTLCTIRSTLMRTYDSLYDLRSQLRDEGAGGTERRLHGILSEMADSLTCGTCGTIVPTLDNSVFVARCGHVYHKTPTNCWQRAGNACHLPDCRRSTP